MAGEKTTLFILFGLSWLACAYLLLTLHFRFRRVYGVVWAWRMIFLGYLLLQAEITWGIKLSRDPGAVAAGDVWFGVFMLVKVLCYAVGFRLWARDRQHLTSPERWVSPAGQLERDRHEEQEEEKGT